MAKIINYVNMNPEQKIYDLPNPSAAEMMDYVNSLNDNIRTGPLEGEGWFVSGTSNEHGSSRPTITLSRIDPANPHVGIISKEVAFEEFKSWQK